MSVGDLAVSGTAQVSLCSPLTPVTEAPHGSRTQRAQRSVPNEENFCARLLREVTRPVRAVHLGETSPARAQLIKARMAWRLTAIGEARATKRHDHPPIGPYFPPVMRCPLRRRLTGNRRAPWRISVETSRRSTQRVRELAYDGKLPLSPTWRMILEFVCVLRHGAPVPLCLASL